MFTTHLSANYEQQWQIGANGLPAVRLPRDELAGVRLLQVCRRCCSGLFEMCAPTQQIVSFSILLANACLRPSATALPASSHPPFNVRSHRLWSWLPLCAPEPRARWAPCWPET